MVRHVTADLGETTRSIGETPMPRGFSWKLAGSALAVAIMVAGLLWNILACTESPMAFSPDGKNLIFSMLQPYESKGVAAAEEPLGRLMVLGGAATPEAKNLRELEQLPKTFITGPGFSVDGKQFCYLRITVPEENAAPATPAGAPAAPADPAKRPSLQLPGEAEPVKIAAGGAIKTGDMGEAPVGQAMLVVRDAATFKVTLTALVDFAIGKEDPMGHPYLTLRPQFGPDGNAIFYTDHYGVHVVDLKEKSASVIQRWAVCPVMSPDHKTLAFVGAKDGNSVVLLASDMSGLTERFLGRVVSPSGLFWINDQTLAALTVTGENNAAPQITTFGRDGKALATVDLPALKDAEKDETGELAISPDGKRMVVCYRKGVRFLDGQGKLQKEVVMKEDVILAQATFTPDGKRVAFKELTGKKEGEKETMQVTSIVFYDPDGQEISRVAVAPSTRGQLP
jgi:hypothetical protein